MKNENGFSLIELLICVVIIAVIAAIAIPNLLASRRASNEGSAIATLRMLHGAQTTYVTTIGKGSYAGDTTLTTAALSQLAAASLIDSSLGSGTKSGYNFTSIKIDASGGTPANVCIRAVPATSTGVTATGPRNIAVSTDGVLYGGDASNAASASCVSVGGQLVVQAGSPL